ncbi:hypothetical protein J5N97_025492 [Dioscorea zingiberensis]|uniref:Band 7 domain-containing protein n=1 Tax=Dioscorea zingiberensis TaxID=325984 RepID=A0A9D5C9X1_9LILI|nr:hypothetical protein J5N97_025492 [Dioscorea zingiberensis]
MASSTSRLLIRFLHRMVLTTRSQLGKITLEKTFEKRDTLNENMWIVGPSGRESGPAGSQARGQAPLQAVVLAGDGKEPSDRGSPAAGGRDQAQKSIHEVASDWGLQCLRYEIRDISPPCEMKAAMEMQAEAERKSCAQVLESERESQAIINIANEKKNSVILASEDAMMDQVKRAKGEAEAILATATEKLRLSSGGFIFFFKSSI